MTFYLCLFELICWFFSSSPNGNSICFSSQISKKGINKHCWVINTQTCCIYRAFTSTDAVLHALHVIHWIFLISKYYQLRELSDCLSNTTTTRISPSLSSEITSPSLQPESSKESCHFGTLLPAFRHRQMGWSWIRALARPSNPFLENIEFAGGWAGEREEGGKKGKSKVLCMNNLVTCKLEAAAVTYFV